MPTHQKHRGAHSKDHVWFTKVQTTKIYQAAYDLSDLLTKGYSERASLQLVGDHFRLNKRQRQALTRITVSTSRIVAIKKVEVSTEDVKDKTVAIDGFNLIIFTESLLSGGYLFEGLDGVFRDIASIHGSYRRVIETHAAVDLLNDSLIELGASSVKWFLDSPVSNSGRLRAYLLSDRFVHNPWEVHVVNNPDRALTKLPDSIIFSNDRMVLESVHQWFNISAFLVDRFGKTNPHIIRRIEPKF